MSGFASVLLLASLFGLIGSLPAAFVNAIVVHFAARRGKDAAWLSAASGALIGTLAAFIFGAIDKTTVSVVFVLTGMLMGVLHWVIAIRPQRRWRLTLLLDEESIQAME